MKFKADNLSDLLLLSKLKQVSDGRTEAIKYIYTKLYKPVYLYSLTILKNPSLAEDAVQETFVRVVTHAKNADESKNIIAWIFGIARNISRDMQKTKFVCTELDSVENNSLYAVEFTEQYITSERLTAALKELNADEREIVLLHVYSELKLTAVSELLDIPYKTVRAKYTYAIKKMRQVFC